MKHPTKQVNANKPVKGKKNKTEFPSNSRVIPENKTGFLGRTGTFIISEWKFVLTSFISGILLVGIVFSGMRLSRTLTELSHWQNTKHELITEMTYWQGVVAEYPEYRDGWFKLSLLSYQLGNKKQASDFLQKVFAIDPNYEPGKVFVKQAGL